MAVSLDTALRPLRRGGALRGRVARLNLTRKLYALLLIAALPLALLCAYQAASRWHDAHRMAQEFPRYLLALQRQVQFKTFVDGVADAVDIGTLSQNAVTAVKEAQALSERLAALAGPTSPELDADLAAIVAVVARSQSLAGLLPLRETIQRTGKAVAEQAQAHHRELDEIVTGSIHDARRDTAVALVTVVLTLGLAFAVGRRLIGGILAVVAGVRQAADSIAAESQRLSDEAGQARERAGHQMHELAAVSDAMGRMVGDITAVAGHAEATAEAAGRTRRVASQAGDYMRATARSQSGMAQRVDESTTAIRTLSQAIGSIGEITGAIRQIAHQTNLLAINASIEAARAGSQGKGFAVVATEVRHLAERTSTSTHDIKSRVDTVEGDAGRAVQAIASVTAMAGEINHSTEATSEILQQILNAAENLNALAGKIASTAAQQKLSTQQVAENMDQIRHLTADSSGGIELVELASRSLVQTAQALQSQVAELSDQAFVKA